MRSINVRRRTRCGFAGDRQQPSRYVRIVESCPPQDLTASFPDVLAPADAREQGVARRHVRVAAAD
jgi:hypothetical protein